MASFKPFNSNRGVSLVGVVVLAALIGLLTFLYMQQANSVRKREALLQEEIYAELHATELLETFRAFESWSALGTYLSASPYSANEMCAHLNILDRASNSLKNPFPIADISTTPLKKANRWIQFRLFDPVNNQTADIWCGTPFNNRVGAFLRLRGGVLDLDQNVNLRVLVTVGVSWEASAGAGGQLQEVALSTLLPSLIFP